MMKTVAALLLLALSGQAMAQEHDHAFYSNVCCNSRDCGPAVHGSVQWTPEGWHVDRTNEVVRFSDTRIQYSPPGEPQFHICIIASSNLLRCLYVPTPEG